MTNKLHHILPLALIFVATSVDRAFTQDSGVMEVEYSDSEKEREREKIIHSPGEADSRYATKYAAPPKDSLTGNQGASTSKTPPPVIPAQQKKTEKVSSTPKPPVKQGKTQDDSILSFNFLYYIIEKYKLQDIVD